MGNPGKMMKQILIITCMIALVFPLFSAGCAKPCFYQTGKSIKQCERDLMQCIYEVELSSYLPHDLLSSPVCAGVQEGIQPAELTCLCMQAMGYEFLDANTLPKNRKRMKIVTLVKNYWIVDGLGVTLDDHRILSEQKHQENNTGHKEVIERSPEISDELRQAILKIVR